MTPDGTKTQSQLWLYIWRARWGIIIPLVLLTLAGCLTSYAAEPPQAATSQNELSLASDTPTATATATPGVTLVPNRSMRALQTTATATDTATPTLTPTATVEPTDTPEPSDTPAPTETPEPTATPRPTTVRPTASPFSAYAWVDNFFPEPGSVVTVFGKLFRNGRPVNGAQMGVTWSYTHGKAFCSAYTSIHGQAACAQNIGMPLQNYWVFIDVVFIYEDQLYYAKTGFLTDP
jgi:hypothetical protein